MSNFIFMSQTIFAIDPGSQKSAFCVFNGERIVEANINSNDDLRSHLSKNLSKDIIVACEHLQCFGMSVGREVFETAYWIGEIRGLISFELGLKFVRVYRSEVKMHLCNSMRAKDSNIRQALMDRFGVKGTKKSPGFFYGFKKDMWSAFAIAVTAFDKQ